VAAVLRVLAAVVVHLRVVRGVRVLVVVVAVSWREGTAVIAGRAGVLVVRGWFCSSGWVRVAGARCVFGLFAGAGHEAWLASTEADSAVSLLWLARYAGAGAGGWDVFVGAVAVPGCGLLEFRRQALCEAGRPGGGAVWYRWHVHGANFGVAAPVCRVVGGFPPMAAGEGRVLVTALERPGYRVLRTAAAPVTTSARLHGRAAGGFGGHLAGLAACAPAPWRGSPGFPRFLPAGPGFAPVRVVPEPYGTAGTFGAADGPRPAGGRGGCLLGTLLWGACGGRSDRSRHRWVPAGCGGCWWVCLWGMSWVGGVGEVCLAVQADAPESHASASGTGWSMSSLPGSVK
jgi:hypothetical protein